MSDQGPWSGGGPRDPDYLDAPGAALDVAGFDLIDPLHDNVDAFDDDDDDEYDHDEEILHG